MGRGAKATDKAAPEHVPEKKQALPTTTAPGPTSRIASTVLSAAAALAKKRKALNDNTNAEKKKILKARAKKVKEAVKEQETVAAAAVVVTGTESTATSVSGSTKLVVELPTRKRRASQASSKVDEPKQASQESTTSNSAIAALKRKVVAATRQAKIVEPEPEPEPVAAPQHEEEPEPKRRRSNGQIAIPKEKPEIVEAAQAVPTKAEDNPFDVGGKKGDEQIGMGTTQRWDDLDAEDADDPTMVAEYVAEIFEYMKELEVSFFYHVAWVRIDSSVGSHDAQSHIHEVPA